MPLGLTPVLATYIGQDATWQLKDLSSAVAAYSGSTGRLVFKYLSGSSFRGDLQLDAITLGGTTAGFESGVDSYQTSTSTNGATSAYTSVTSWTNVATSTINGRWNRDTGNTTWVLMPVRFLFMQKLPRLLISIFGSAALK